MNVGMGAVRHAAQLALEAARGYVSYELVGKWHLGSVFGINLNGLVGLCVACFSSCMGWLVMGG
jgi:hypothetical protein